MSHEIRPVAAGHPERRARFFQELERERCIAKPVVIEDMLDVIERQLGRTGAADAAPADAPPLRPAFGYPQYPHSKY